MKALFVLVLAAFTAWTVNDSLKADCQPVYDLEQERCLTLRGDAQSDCLGQAATDYEMCQE